MKSLSGHAWTLTTLGVCGSAVGGVSGDGAGADDGVADAPGPAGLADAVALDAGLGVAGEPVGVGAAEAEAEAAPAATGG